MTANLRHVPSFGQGQEGHAHEQPGPVHSFKQEATPTACHQRHGHASDTQTDLHCNKAHVYLSLNSEDRIDMDMMNSLPCEAAFEAYFVRGVLHALQGQEWNFGY